MVRETKKRLNEFAEVIPWEPKWSAGAPMPQVFANGKTYLIYLIDVPDPNWDGSYVTCIDNTSDANYPLALVEFSGSKFRFGIANDEVFSGLPLWGKGLKFYEAHEIINSSWIDELDSIQKVHPQYDGRRKKDYNHYCLLFHDQIFEIIASGYTIETFETSFENLAIEVAKRMINNY